MTHTSTSHTGSDTHGTPGGSRTRSPAVVIALCFVSIVFDGYDLVVYGAVVPDLLAYPAWGLSPVGAGNIGSYALFGMLVGALSIGYLTDVVGRRAVMIASVTFFSLMMLLLGRPAPSCSASSASSLDWAWAASSRPPSHSRSSTAALSAATSTMQ